MSISIPEHITTIGKSAFKNCTNLKNIIIPKSVTYISQEAFYNCSNITIHGYDNSYAQEYTIKNNIPFISINTDTMVYKVIFLSEFGGNIPKEQSKVHNKPLILSNIFLQYSGFVFEGWATTPDGEAVYQPGDSYTENADITLYAVWEEIPLIYGDIQGDGEVDVSDVIFTLQLLASGDMTELTERERNSADVNCDDSIDVSDVIRILQYLASPGTTHLGPRGILQFFKEESEPAVLVNTNGFCRLNK